MWKIGERVLAPRNTGVYQYPGTIRHIDGERCYVIFDDGEDAFIAARQLIRCRFEAGDQVFVQHPADSEFQVARVKGVTDNNLTVRFGNGKEQRVELKRIRVDPQTWKLPDLAESVEVASTDWELGDRVFACWFDLEWYPGIVLETEGDRICILFDNHNQAFLPAHRVRPMELAEGDEVVCRHKHGPEFQSAEVLDFDGERVRLLLEDGDEETTSIRLIHLTRDEWFPENPHVDIRRGEQVLGQFYDMYWYPGMIVSVNGKRIHIAFVDGDQAWVTPAQVQEFDIEPGSRVFAVRQLDEERADYMPAEVVEMDGERMLVRFEEDDEEDWRPLQMVRLER